MIALPSIAFGGFAGSAKGVTARRDAGRTVLSARSRPTGYATPSQMVRRAALGRISRAYRDLTPEQRRGWEALAERAGGASLFGQGARLSGHNLFVRLNANRAYCGATVLLATAPGAPAVLPAVEFTDYCISEGQVVFVGVPDPEGGLRLVAKMSDGQPAGVTSAWGRTVIVSPDGVPDWGDIDLTGAFGAVMGHAPVNGRRYFVELYWIDPATGFTGVPVRVERICQDGSFRTGEPIGPRAAVRDRDLLRDEYDHLHGLSLEFTSAPAILTVEADYDTGDYGSQAAKAHLPESVADRFPDFRAYVVGRRSAAGGHWPAFFEVHKWAWGRDHELSCGSRGGRWTRQGVIFGTCPAFEF